MAELTDAQRKRKEAREKRRGPEPEASDDADSGSAQQPLDAVKSAAKVAAAGAAVGAAAAAARALGSRHEEDEAGKQEAEPEPEQEADPESQVEPEQSEPEQPEEEGSQPEPQDDQEQDEPRAESVEERGEQDDRRQEPVEGEALGDASKAAGRAKEQLEELLGKPAESVSSLERTHDGWVVVLEVVELRRIPESTDVLASYELELDEKLNFRRYQQAARYTRSQASRGEES
jgi:hypothetical protein